MGTDMRTLFLCRGLAIVPKSRNQPNQTQIYGIIPSMKFRLIVLSCIAALTMAWASWLLRYTTNTAGGRFFKTDRWTGRTTVVEKDGSCHEMQDY